MIDIFFHKAEQSGFYRIEPWLVALSALWLMVMTGCGQSEPPIQAPTPGEVVMEIGDQSISVRDLMLTFQETGDFESYLATRKLAQADRRGVQQNLEVTSATDWARSLAMDIAFETEIAQRAMELQLDQTPAHQSQMETTLQDELYQWVLIQDVLKKINITESEMRRFYEENRDALFKKPDTGVYRVRGIYLFSKPPHRSREEALQLAQDAYEQLESGVDFETVALTYSDAPIQKRGKAFALAPEQIADPKIEEVLESLQAGEHSNFFEGSQLDRFYIYKLEEKIDPEFLSFEESERRIRQILYNERRNQGIFFLSEQLRDKHNCIVNLGLLSQSTAEQDEQQDILILSVPDVFSLTLGEFLDLAHENEKFTQREQESYLEILTNKAVFLAEALSRGWGEEEVGPFLEIWKRKDLVKRFVEHQAVQHEFTEEEIRSVYENQQDSDLLQTPRRVDLYHWFFPADHSATMNHYERRRNFQMSNQRALQVLEAVRQGRPFREAGLVFEGNESGVLEGGRIGWLAVRDASLDIQNIIRPLEAGELSQPEQVFDPNDERYGYELYHIEDMQPPRPMTYEEAREVILQVGNQGKQREIHQALRQDFRQAVEVETQSQPLAQVVAYLDYLAERPDEQVDITRYATSPANRQTASVDG